jgi:hypothetical protein
MISALFIRQAMVSVQTQIVVNLDSVQTQL